MKLEFFEIISGRYLLNLTGGTIRFIYGTIWRTIFDKPRFTYSEYLYGIQDGDFWNEFGQESGNRIVAFIFIVIIILFVSFFEML
ncbi:MAG: hypothetical protein V4648_08525 [Bacteroidota bacterium]